MKCFSACFGTSKRRNHRKSADETPSKDHSRKAAEAIHSADSEPENQSHPIKPSNEKPQEQLYCGDKKEVSFDSKIKPCESESTLEINDDLAENKDDEKSGTELEEAPKESESVPNLLKANSLSTPPRHRYENYVNSDEENADIDLELTPLDEEEEGDGDADKKSIVIQEESSESLFSLSIGSKKHVCAAEFGEKEVNSPFLVHDLADFEHKETSVLNGNARDRSQYVHSVLNPVENLTQWKTAKEKTVLQDQPQHHQEKENINLEKDFNIPISPEPTFKLSLKISRQKFNSLKPADQDIAVDTSLSSWLLESESTPKSKSSTHSYGNSPLEKGNSASSYEDRPILGALTLEDIKKFSATSSPRRSRSRSPDETPIIGSVGSYWSHTVQDTNSGLGSRCRGMTNISRRNREEERVNWNPMPFAARLEKALESSIAEV